MILRKMNGIFIEFKIYTLNIGCVFLANYVYVLVNLVSSMTYRLAPTNYIFLQINNTY